jgi:hypothetical protein
MANFAGLLKPGDVSLTRRTWRRACPSARSRRAARWRASQSVLAELSASPAESHAVNRLVDRRLLFECAVTHYATVNACFIPYPIELLRKSNCDHVALVAALGAGRVEESVEIARKHVDVN